MSHDITHLIMAVESYPCLWDNNHEDYHNRDVKELAWQAIAKEIYSDWERFDEIKQTSTCNRLKKKWTYIRDYYRKDQQRINRMRSGSGTKPIKKSYTYSPFLAFLKPTFKRKKTGRNHNDDDADLRNESDNMEASSSNQSQDLESSLQQNDDATFEARLTASSPASTTTKVTKTKQNMAGRIIVNRKNPLEQRASEPSPTKALFMDNDDVQFLLSFRGDMKMMSPSQKLDFKIEMLQSVKRIMNHGESPYSRLSTASNDSNPVTYIYSPSASLSNSL